MLLTFAGRVFCIHIFCHKIISQLPPFLSEANKPQLGLRVQSMLLQRGRKHACPSPHRTVGHLSPTLISQITSPSQMTGANSAVHFYGAYPGIHSCFMEIIKCLCKDLATLYEKKKKIDLNMHQPEID